MHFQTHHTDTGYWGNMFSVQIRLYGNFLYKLKKIVGPNNFSAQFIKVLTHYKEIGYSINVVT